jgi:nitrite reductase/ring-hydroxylating ferredoxin subunit
MSAPTKSKTRHAVAKIGEIAVGKRKICKIPGFGGKEIEIGVFNVGGRFFAYRNVCPHAGAPICVGKVCGTTLPSNVGEYILAREGEIVRCPWHGWEFDLLTGEHLVDEKMKLRGYDVETGSDNLEGFTVETEGETVWILI